MKINFFSHLVVAIALSVAFPAGIVIYDTSNSQAIAQVNPPTESIGEILQRVDNKQAVTAIEQTWERDYENYFKANLSDASMGSAEIAQTLAKLSSQTGKKTALIYAIPTPTKLELVLVLPQKDPIRKTVAQANQELLVNTVKNLIRHLKNYWAEYTHPLMHPKHCHC